MSGAANFDEFLDRSNLTGRQFLIYAGQRLHPGVAVYNSVYANRWPGLDLQRFQLAWQRLLQSCDALRIVIDEIDGIPQQRTLPVFAAPVECVDLRERGGESAVNEWVRARLEQPIILATRIYDSALLQISDRDYAWFLHIHHIVVDGAGVQILLRRLTEFYDNPQGATAEFPQFEPCAALACAGRSTDNYREARQYWLRNLQEVPPTPYFYGVDAFRRTAQERVVLRLEAHTASALAALACSLSSSSLSEHAARANLFNAIFAAYLSRVTGTDRVSIGVTFHNRNCDAERRTVGLFMEVFPIVLRVDAADTVTTLMQQVAICTSRALKHRRYSVGHSARAPAFSGLFNYMRALATPTGALQVRRIHAGHGANAISLSVEPRGDTFDLWFDVNSDVADTSSAQRIADNLRVLLQAAVEHPDRPLAWQPLLSPTERGSLLELCSGPVLPILGNSGCHTQFERWAADTPGADAVVSAGARIKYGDLDRRATALARKLRSLGARAGRHVGICLERSPDMIVAVLAVLKSGAAYVPLDPSYPPARLALMLTDAEPVALITTTAAADTLPPHAARTLFLDQDQHPQDADDSDLPPVADSDLAYVIYTSGTTGTPKGVLVSHRNVQNHLAWRASFFPLTANDRCLQTASLSFDDSVWEILEPLSAGACVVLTRARFEYDSSYLVGLMSQERVTVACFVPSLLRGVIEDPAIADCAALRRLTTGGEGLSLPLQRSVREKLPAAAFFNGYGTTEATIASVYWRCVEMPGQTSVPIGRPIANTQVYVLDRNGQLVPPGVLGEICIGGTGVARGYLQRPQLTAERFVDDRIGAVAGLKLYRTGDLGRIRADGVFEFAGRLDNQVKIRGVRVELGDVEAAVLDHPRVRAAAVVRNETGSGVRLTAYIVQRGSQPLAAADLRAFVRDRLPAALVPNRFETLSALPLLPNGKLDRNALPVEANEDECNVSPRNELETRLVRWWEQVLQARPIGVRNDFFELGGHSLSAVKLATFIGRSLGRNLSPGLLFECPTIESLASRLTAPANRSAVLLLADGGPAPPLFLIHHVSGDITAYRDLAPHLGGARRVFGVRAPELDCDDAPLERVELMAARYIGEIRSLQPRGPYVLGGHSAGAHIAFEMAQQLTATGERVALLAILEADARRPGGRGLADILRHRLALLRTIPGEQRARFLWDRLTRARRDRRESTPGNEEARHPVWKAMERAVRDYRPNPYPGAITLFRATDRRITGTYSRTLGWGRLARGGVRVIDVPGTHATVLRPGAEPPMAVHLRARLDELTG